MTTEEDNPAIPSIERTQRDRIAAASATNDDLAKAEGRIRELHGMRDAARAVVVAAIEEKMNQIPPEGLL